MPTVSVVVPCYKYGQYVTGCVTSLLENSEVDLDILVVDDASPDDSWSVVERLPQLDPRVRVQRNEQNQGLIATANAAIMAATGDYVVLLSADDAHAPGWLDRGVSYLERNPQVVLAYGPARHFTGSVPVVHKQRPVDAVVYSGHDWLKARCTQGFPEIYSPEAIVRTTAQHEIGGYRPELPYSSDMEMWMRLASVGDVVRVGGPVAALYRVSAQSMSQVARAHLISELEFCRDAFDAWYEFADGRVPDRDPLLAAAKNALARRAVRRAKVALLADALSGEFDDLCKFALECDAVWATPQVERLHIVQGHRWARGLLRCVGPVTNVGLRTYRAVDDIRYRLRAR